MTTYFIGNNINNWVKIGKTENINKRVLQINSLFPFVNTHLILKIEGDYERWLHKKFAPYIRNNGKKCREWFELPFDVNSEEGKNELSKIETEIETRIETCYQYLRGLKWFSEWHFEKHLEKLGIDKTEFSTCLDRFRKEKKLFKIRGQYILSVHPNAEEVWYDEQSKMFTSHAH